MEKWRVLNPQYMGYKQLKMKDTWVPMVVISRLKTSLKNFILLLMEESIFIIIWQLNQPSWKICGSQIGSFTQGKNKNVWNHHLVIVPNFGWLKFPTKGIIFLLFQWFLGLPGTREPPFVLKVVPKISRVETALVRLIILGKPLYFPPFTGIPWCPKNLGKKSIQNMTPLCRENLKIHYTWN